MRSNLKRVMLTALATPLAACATAPQQPAVPYSYRAVGNEPGWSLTIDKTNITYVGDYGEVRIVEPTPRAIVAFAGEIYQTPRLNVNIVHGRCNDGMSDRLYSDKVEVVADGKKVSGCGGEILIPTSLADTSWRVVAVNGRTTPGGPGFFMRFDAARLSARFGCNHLGADYRQSGDTLAAGPVVSTRMACAEPIMSLEREAAAVLAQPMRTGWTGGGKLTLANAAGRLGLERSH